MRTYKNYIFDLYGTLVNIDTDENSQKLWQLMADFYNVYGCEWGRKALWHTFWKYDKAERKAVRKATGIEYPEIKLEKVFARLLFEVRYHDTGSKIADENIDALRQRYLDNQEKIISLVARSEWAMAVSNLFRVASRRSLSLYKNTLKTLDKLKTDGRKLYILSNAQRIFTDPEIQGLDLDHYFDKIYLSSDHGMMKPQKEFLEQLLRREGIDRGETVLVGNEIYSDVLSALRCDMDCILINTGMQKKKDIKKALAKMIKTEKITATSKVETILSGDVGEIIP